MDNRELDSVLNAVKRQHYPLFIDEKAAEAFLECFRRIMAMVPEDDHILIRADYDLATSALYHPSL